MKTYYCLLHNMYGEGQQFLDQHDRCDSANVHVVKTELYELTAEEVEVINHCLQYTDDHDDEGVRCSEAEAERRASVISRLFEIFSED